MKIAEDLLVQAEEQLIRARRDLKTGAESRGWMLILDAYETIVRASGEALHASLADEMQERLAEVELLETEIFEFLERTRRLILARLGVVMMPAMTPAAHLTVLPGGKSNPERHADAVARTL